MAEFKPGDVVDIAIKGVRIASTPIKGQTLGYSITDEHGDLYRLPPQAAAERGAPAGWPPQHKDVWRDADGDLWLACSGDVDLPINMICSAAAAPRSVEALVRFGPLVLVHREESTP